MAFISLLNLIADCGGVSEHNVRIWVPEPKGPWALLPHVPRRRAFAAKASGDWTRTVMNIALAGTAMWVLLWLVIRKFSSAGAREGVEPRISVAH